VSHPLSMCARSVKRLVPNRFVAPKGGESFHPDTGKYYSFAPSEIVVIRAWPLPAAWHKTEEQPVWRQFRPPHFRIRPPTKWLPTREVSFLKEYRTDPSRMEEGKTKRQRKELRSRAANAARRLPFRLFLDIIPSEIIRPVARFNERHFHLISWLARCGPYALDFLLSNPALAFCVASHWVFHQPRVQQAMRAARALLRHRRRDILRYLGVTPADEATVRLFAKILPESVSIVRLLYLRTALREDASLPGRLAHVRSINAGVLRIAEPRLISLAAPALLDEIASSPEERRRPRAAYLLRDASEMAAQMALPLDQRRFHSIRSLKRKHDELVHRYNLWVAESISKEGARLPNPFQGFESDTVSIVPLDTPTLVAEEGRQMEHCCASYIPRMYREQNCALYRVAVKGERATLSLVRYSGKWRMGELRGIRNCIPSKRIRSIAHGYVELLSKEHPESVALDAADDIPF
jgi:hypothetical protein